MDTPDAVDLVDKAFVKVQRDGKKIMDDKIYVWHIQQESKKGESV